MKQIYSFESKTPLVLNERKLGELMEFRKLQKQTTLLAAGGILMQLCLLYMAIIVRFDNPIYSIALISYVVFSLTGFTVISIITTTKRRELKCVLPL